MEIEIEKTNNFIKWFNKLKDRTIIRKIRIRLNLLRNGDFGSWKYVGGTVSELKFDCGPGYRIYFTRDGEKIIILLVGGTKQRQSDDIAKAQEMAKEWREQNGKTNKR